MTGRRLALWLASASATGLPLRAQAPHPSGPDLSWQPTLYAVGYAHLDTQWRWEYPQTISEYLPQTLRDNFALIETYPHYVFNFTGANRYRLMKEYSPADYARLQRYVAAGRWYPAGSSVEESDVNVPSAEAILRQVLYGNAFFRRELGRASAEFMLPDCFGFPWALPSILAHAGITGFSTQKLTWGSSVPDQPSTPPGLEGKGVPFNVGVWLGPDGRGVIAALNAGHYGRVREDLSRDTAWIARVERNGRRWGVFADYRYYGTGDRGGAPDPRSVASIEQSVAGSGPLHVVSATADQMFLDLTPEEVARLPRYSGEMELTNHSAGTLTSQAYLKRWNHQNELLAAAAEEASVAAEWLGARRYPLGRLNEAWTLVLGAQSHDILAGTATPQAYAYSWNDDVLAMNQFAGVLTDATDAIASLMNTATSGTPLAVYNPLNIAREDIVEATIRLPSAPHAIRVVGPDGEEVRSQLDSWSHGQAKILFVAQVPSVGYAVYDVRAAGAPPPSAPLQVTESSLENARYRIRVDPQGDVASIFDKRLRRELLSAPARLALLEDRPAEWPAWNMDWDDVARPPRAFVGGPVTVRVTERGPVRVALTIARGSDSSRFVQTIRLSAGDGGNRVEFLNAIDWKMPETVLKATFPLTAADSVATYNGDAGTIRRGNASERKFEVPSHQWFDLTDRSGAFGVTVLSDDKYGSDKPTDNTLRLTLLRSPGISAAALPYADQASQDWGHHQFLYGLASHAGDWRTAQTDWQGWRLNQPLIAFETPKHRGVLGRRFAWLRLNSGRVRVLALKKAEASEEYVVRLVDLDGRLQPSVRLSFATPIVAAREVNGQEQPLGPATVRGGELATSLGPFGMRSFAVKLGGPARRAPPPQWQAVPLPYDLAVASHDGSYSLGGFDALGQALPAELLPAAIPYGAITFQLGPARTGAANAVVARGQTISLPGRATRVYLLAASADGDQTAPFRVGDRPFEVTIQDWGGFLGQWDTRSFKRVAVRSQRWAFLPPRIDAYASLSPGFIKRAPVAWFASHRHTADGDNEPYAYAYLFAYCLEAPAHATTLTLPTNDKIRVLAVTASNQGGAVQPAQPLYDTLERGPP
jgi:alpha-mannosidase